jgi:hypothetical protein
LSLPELIDWVSGVSRLSTPQIEALGRKMGLIDTPYTGVDLIRDRLRIAMKKRAGSLAYLEWPGGGKGEDNLRAFVAGENCLTFDEMSRLAREFFGKNISLDPQTAMLRSDNTAAASMGVGPPPFDPAAHFRAGLSAADPDAPRAAAAVPAA